MAGMSRNKTTVRQYVTDIIEEGTGSEDLPYFLQHSQMPDSIHSDYIAPKYFDDNRFMYTTKQRQDGALFYVGAKGSGVSFHEHTNAWNGLVFGRKVRLRLENPIFLPAPNPRSSPGRRLRSDVCDSSLLRLGRALKHDTAGPMFPALL